MKKKKEKVEYIELNKEEFEIVLKSIKKYRDYIAEERFYRHQYPECFYQEILIKQAKILSKFDIMLPKAVFIKVPKFF